MISGLKKEFLFFLRGGRLAVVAIVMLALAVMSPLMFGAMSGMIDAMEGAMPDNEQYEQMTEMFTSFSASDMVMYNVEYVGGLGGLILLFLFKGAAGGEQKKRSVIIPQCAGLDAERYVIPKFLVYPPCVFAISVAAIFAGTGVSLIVFPGKLDMGLVCLSAISTGVYLAFTTAVQFCIGVCTGRSNLAVVSVIIMQTFLPSILSFFRVDRFNPTALYSIALTAAQRSGETGNVLLSTLESASVSDDISALNVAVSLGTAIVISVLLYFVTVFTLHTQEVHNEGNEPIL
ncbi:MAG: hypothetical protein IK093_08020 [Ruminiclostridium sp.]|nr:hypothetical protein [Ruminiclostridium sp.]